MRKQTAKKLIFTLLGLVFLGLFWMVGKPAYATGPNLISFQGKVVNADGTNVANGTYNFNFVLFDDASLGSESDGSHDKWHELSKSITVTNGVFQTELGSATTLPDFNTNTALYLAIKFNGDAQGYMSPRVHLDSVPYARNADNLGGLSASAFAQLSAANAFTNTNGITVNSATALQVSSTTGQILTVDTSGNQLILGKPGASGITGKLTFDNATNAFTAAIQSGITSASYTWTLPTADSSGCIQSNGTGTLSVAACGGSVAFNNVTAGTNVAALVIGTGGSLTISGSGTINATSLNGATFAAPGTIGGTTPGAATFTTATANTSVTSPTYTSTGALAINTASNGNITLNPNGSGATIAKSSTNSTTAFQVQNAIASNVFVVDTTPLNTILTNSNFEGSDVSTWVALGASAAVSRVTTQAFLGSASLNVQTSTTASSGVKFVTGSGSSALATGTIYSISWYDKLDTASAALTDIRAVYARDGSTEVACSNLNTQYVVSTGWVRHSCQITTDSTAAASTAYIAIEQAANLAHNFYIDAVQIEAASSPSAYKENGLSLNGVINSPVVVKNVTNSTNAFSIQSSSGATLQNWDTQNGILSFANPNNRTTVSFNMASATNVITNPGFENANGIVPPGWAKLQGGETTFATDNGVASHDGAENLKIVTVASTANQGAKYVYKFLPNTTYFFSVWVSTSSTLTNNLDLGTVINGSAQTNCLAQQTPAATMTQYSCTFNSGATTTASDFVYVRDNNATSTVHTFYIDSAYLQTVNDGFVNLVSNPSFETGSTNGWLSKPTAGGAGNSIANSTDIANFGSRSMKVVTGTIANQGAQYFTPLVLGTQYSLSFWAKEAALGTGNNLFNVGRSDTSSAGGTVSQAGSTTLAGSGTAFAASMIGDTIVFSDGTTDTITAVASTTSATVTTSRTIPASTTYQILLDTADCLSGQTFDTIWRQFTCTFTSSSTINWRPSIYIKNTGTNTNTAYIDGVTLVQAPSGLSFAAPAANIQVDSQLNNITLNGNTSGDIQPWKQNFNALPFARRHAGAVTGAGFVYYIGGLSGALAPAAVNAVNYAKLSSNGTIGSWNCQGTVSSASSCGPSGTAVTNANSLPVALYGAAVIEANGYIYVIGGCSSSDATANCTARVSTVYYAQIKPDGSTGAWQTNLYAAYAAGYASVAVSNGYIYEMGGYNGAAGLTTIQSAKLNADGSTGPWTAAANALNTGVYGATAHYANGTIYVIGGCTDNAAGTCTTPSNVVQRTTPTNGADTVFSTGTNLAIATGLHSSVLLNGNIYVMGGRQLLNAAAAPTSSVIYSKINVDGSLGNWSASTDPLPAMRQGGSAIENNSYIDYLGGYDGTNVNSTVYTSSGARTLVYGGLDLVGLSSLTNTDPNGAGALTAGNTKIVGRLRVDDQATLNNGLVVNGTVSITNFNSSVIALNIADPVTGANLFNVKDLSTNFGGATTSGAFIQKNSYFGEEFNVFKTTNCAPAAAAGRVGSVFARGDLQGGGGAVAACAPVITTPQAANTGELGVDILGGATLGGTCKMWQPSATTAYGVEEILATGIATASTKADCLEYQSASTAFNTEYKPFAVSNLPVFTAKVKVSNITNANAMVFVGLAGGVAGQGIGTAADGMPTDGIFFSNCTTYSTTTPTCPTSNVTWQGYVVAGSAVIGSIQACSNTAEGGAINASNYSYLRIEVRNSNTNDIHFFVDSNTSTGINETECGTGVTTGTTPGATTLGLMLQANVNANQAVAQALDIDYVRIWQDDPPTPPPSVSTTTDTTTTDPAATGVVSPPLVINTSSGPDPNTELVKFTAATSDDSVFNKDVYVKGTLYADKIKANQIEGLQLFVDEIKARLASQNPSPAPTQTPTSTSSTANPGITTTAAGSAPPDGQFNLQNIQIVNLVVLAQIESKGGLVVAKDAQFNGKTIFQLLAEFNGSANFNGQATFNNDAGGGALIKKDTKKISINFTHEYPQAPIVVANWSFADTKDASGNVIDPSEDKQRRLLDGGFSCLVANVTTKGFDILINKTATEDLNLNWLATSIKDAKITTSNTGTQ